MRLPILLTMLLAACGTADVTETDQPLRCLDCAPDPGSGDPPVPTVSCDDNNPCTVDSLVGKRCAHRALADGTSCDDGDLCNGRDACAASVCVRVSPAISCDDGNVCTSDGCDPASGACVYAANQAACGGPNDQCSNGHCYHEAAPQALQLANGFFAQELRGVVSTTATESLNRCVNNPAAQVARLRGHGQVLGFGIGNVGYPGPSDLNGSNWHWQGIQRLPSYVDSRTNQSVDLSRYAVLPSSQDHAIGGKLAIVRFQSADGRVAAGQRLRGNRFNAIPDFLSTPDSSLDRITRRVDLPDTDRNHPSGIQLVGRHLLVPQQSYGGSGAVSWTNNLLGKWPIARLYDLAAADASEPPLRWSFNLSDDADGVLFAGITAVQDPNLTGSPTRYLFAAGVEVNNAGIDNPFYGGSGVLVFRHPRTDFYLGLPDWPVDRPGVFGPDAPLHADSTSSYDARHYDASVPGSTENIAFLTDCATRALYMLALRDVDHDNAEVDLFRIHLVPDANGRVDGREAFRLVKDDGSPEDWSRPVVARSLSCLVAAGDPPGRQCDFDKASGAYVDPAGRLIVYGTQGDWQPGSTPRFTTMVEFVGEDPNAACSSDWVELFGEPTDGAAGPYSMRIDLADQSRRNYSDFGSAYWFDDATRSAQWCLSSGLKYVLYRDPGRTGPFSELSGSGSYQQTSWFPTPGWSSGCFMPAGANPSNAGNCL